jgi:hypothetical protein
MKLKKTMQQMTCSRYLRVTSRDKQKEYMKSFESCTCRNDVSYRLAKATCSIQ